MDEGAIKDEILVELRGRSSLCISGAEAGITAHEGDPGFRQAITRHYRPAESNAVEELVLLKQKLRRASATDFWRVLMEGMTTITGAQYGFVSKRVLRDDDAAIVEMPPIGQPGSCLLGVAFYYNDGDTMNDFARDWKYWEAGTPCAYMKHEKVFLVPDGLPQFCPNNPNPLPFPAEAYIGIPLFAETKCFGHFGIMWNKSGLNNLRLSWAYIEMLLHALEDVILEKLVETERFARTGQAESMANVISSDAVAMGQSWKPYARGLSHELRTPMQGVVGMLDLMQATVQESIESFEDPAVRRVLASLAESLDVVQDSSRRAVEAADNVVLASDLNMQVPDTPLTIEDGGNGATSTPKVPTDYLSARTSQTLELADVRPNKRSRRASDVVESETYRPPKLRQHQSAISALANDITPQTISIEHGHSITKQIKEALDGAAEPHDPLSKDILRETESNAEHTDSDTLPTPSFRHAKIRELLRFIVNESLRSGGRPESAFAQETECGEIIEVKSRKADGEIVTKIVDWSVDREVPESIMVDERDLAKLISCVVQNAIKFTEQGRITLRASLPSRSKLVSIRVVDTGSGIPEDFIPYLFRPFSREDDSLTRQKEGLGLGLLVAKGLARKIGGDLVCVRTDVSGPNRGSEFEVRVPLSIGDLASSRASTPRRTPTPTTLTPPEMTRSSSSRHRQPPPPRSVKETEHAILPAATSPTAKRLSYSHLLSPVALAPAASRFEPQLVTTDVGTPVTPLLTTPRPSIDESSIQSAGKSPKNSMPYHNLATEYPLTFLVADDNTLNRRLLVSMLQKLGYTDIHEAYDGADAVRQMSVDRPAQGQNPIDVVLMDLWMPNMDGYQATEKIYAMQRDQQQPPSPQQHPQPHEKNNGNEPANMQKSESNGDTHHTKPANVTVLAVTADITNGALERVSEIGMAGFLTKPYKLRDLEKKILTCCVGSLVSVA